MEVRTRHYVSMRRERGAAFACNLFADPAWDIMLDLLISRLRNRSISVSSACLASGVANSTALGWIKKLQVGGLVVREVDVKDGRRTFLRLTTKSEAALVRWVQQALGGLNTST